MKNKWKYLDELIESLEQDFEDDEEIQESILQRLIQKHKAKMKYQKSEPGMKEESTLMRVLRKYKNKQNLKERFLAEMDELEQLEETDQLDLEEDTDVRLDAYSLSRGGLWLGIFLAAATPYIGNASLLLVPSVDRMGEYYIFSRNRRVELEVTIMEDGSVLVNVEQAPSSFYRMVRLILQNLRRFRTLLSPITVQSEELNKVLSTFRDLKVEYVEAESE